MRKTRWDSILKVPLHICSYVSFSLLTFAMSEFPAYLLLSTLLILPDDGLMRVEGGLAAAGRGIQADTNVNFIVKEGSHQRAQQSKHQDQRASVSKAESAFILKVQVKDIASRQHLVGASVGVFVNYTRTNSALTTEDGAVLLKVPYTLGLPLTIVASMDGYILTPLPWKTTKMPIFSSVTLSLFSQNQGNIWLFEDSVLITGRIYDTLSQPNVQFPKNRLILADRNISSITAYLTMPQLPAQKHGFLYNMGILINKSGHRSIELNPLAAVHAQLFCNGREVQVSGPIQITLPLPDNSRLRASNSVPAWSFDNKTGAWVNQGLGIVKMEEDSLVWTYVAPHLGYWIAAPFPSSRGYMGHASTLDFISYHTYLLMAILGGTLIIVIGFLTVLLCYCRGSVCEPERRRVSAIKMVVLKKDQSTSTNNNNHLEVYFKDSAHHEDRSHSAAAWAGSQRDQLANSRCQGNFNIYVDGAELPSVRPSQHPLYVNSSEIVRPKEVSEQKREPLSLNENMFFPERLVHIYNQPVAILQAPEFFHSSEQQSGCKSATLPRKGTVYDNLAEPVSKDGFIQTLPKIPLLSELQQQVSEEKQAPEGPQGSTSNSATWSRYSSLLESVSVPGTLNEAMRMSPFCSDLQGISEQTLLELSKGKPFPNPRAWFVSLDGKPAAQIRHSVLDLQRKQMPTDSNDTSLDSGVDMNEHHSGKKLERERTFVRSGPHGRALYTEDMDLSSSESGTTAACTPEDPAIRNILDSSSGTIPNIPEERDGADTSSAQEDSESRSTPPPRRLRKVKDKSKAGKQKSTWHLREERPLMKLN